MCGIIGYADRENYVDQRVFDQMRDRLAHRGPDGFGTKVLNDGRVVLGHRRLSIIDLSDGGTQPMSNEDGTVWITFNGEIYNYQDLRTSLILAGHGFKSKSDTEVIIHGYEQWGIRGLLEKIKGMFAFAIWDENKKELICARDRFGIKPFYYFFNKTKFVFASEIKAIKEDKTIYTTLDPHALSKYFNYSYIPNPYTIWKEIKKLPPANHLVYDFENGEIKIEKYWEPCITQKEMSDEEAIETTDYLIEKAVREHMVSDVPVGLFLSGGYDSATLLMHMKKSSDNISSFNIGFKNSDRSEHILSQKLADAFKANHHVEMMGRDYNFFNLVKEMAPFYDEPYAISSMIPYFLVSKSAAKNHKVVLAGDGGDEGFAGYKWHYSARSLMKEGWRKNLRFLKTGKKRYLIENYNAWMPGSSSEIKPTLNHDLQNLCAKEDLNIYRSLYFDTEDYVKLYQHFDLNTFIPEPCLTRADRSSMAHSLEVRVPFLDHEIFEFTMRLKSSVYMKDGIKKFLIHENLKGKVNNEILNAPKRGFSYPFLSSLFNHEFEQMIMEGNVRSLGYFNENFSLNSQSEKVKFQLLMLELWFINHGGA